MPVIADEQLAALLRDAAAQPAADSPGDASPADAETEVIALRRAGRARAATRAAGPAMPTVDKTMGGVPVRVYQPGAAVTVVYLHGGGFVIGDLETHDALVRRFAAATGATFVAVDYRRAPEHPWPAAVDDAVAVITELDGIGTRIAVAGDSAGGLIAVLAALRVRGAVPLVAQLLVCPNIDPALRSPSVRERATGWLLDADTLRRWIGMWLPDPATRDLADPLLADLRGLPPAVVVTAEHDPLRDEGAAYAARLREAGAPVTHRCEPGLIHNFPTLRDVSPACAEAEARYLRDADRLLRGE